MKLGSRVEMVITGSVKRMMSWDSSTWRNFIQPFGIYPPDPIHHATCI